MPLIDDLQNLRRDAKLLKAGIEMLLERIDEILKNAAPSFAFASPDPVIELATMRRTAEELANEYGCPLIGLRAFEPSHEVVNRIPRELMDRHGLVAIAQTGKCLLVAMANPGDVFAIDDVKLATGCHVDVAVAGLADIKKTIVDAAGKTASKKISTNLVGRVKNLALSAIDPLTLMLIPKLQTCAMRVVPIIKSVNFVVIAYDADMQRMTDPRGAVLEILRPGTHLYTFAATTSDIDAALKQYEDV